VGDGASGMEELVDDNIRNSYASPNIIRVIQLVEHVQYTEVMRISCGILAENLRGKARTSIWIVILKLIFRYNMSDF
jgi:hypothetical protein